MSKTCLENRDYHCFLTDGPLVSVVVPVYNVEKYLERCVDSLLRQTYQNLEIILVDDGSTDGSLKIMEKYAKEDDRIHLVQHEKNRGLFQARITGSEAAHGKYIAFVDSDDYVSLDYYRLLVRQAQNTGADIVIGQTVFEKADHSKIIKNLHNACFNFNTLNGTAVKKAFFGQQGQCYSWHTVWNKLYKKELWDQCAPFYKHVTSHVIMTEDIAFSSVLFYFAEVVSTIHSEAIFYCENEGASTDSRRITFKKFKKNISDITCVFNFVESFLNEQKAEDWLKKDFHEFRKYYARMWRELGLTSFKKQEKDRAAELLSDFLSDYEKTTEKDDHFFERFETNWDGRLEDIKENILKSKADYVSFDIFDTVVLRPFWEPTDLFRLLDQKFREIYPTNISFYDIRVAGEREARRQNGANRASFQDVTIDEIYAIIQDVYKLPFEVVQQMEIEEKCLELRFCKQRHVGKEIFEFAKAIGKRVIFISDMYLDRETIEKLLQKNGFTGYDALFLSSEERLTKHTGDLFKVALKKLNIKGKQVIHIGDTWESDIVRPQKYGIDVIFLPKTKEVFENHIKGITTNSLETIGDRVTGAIQNTSAMHKNIGYGSMKALAANWYFDNPYRGFAVESDFNADPYFIGFYALGMHLLGLIQWVKEHSKKYQNVQFLSRDGCLLLKAYEIAQKYQKDILPCGYLYSSRKAVLPEMIETLTDFFDLPVEYHNHTPATILKLLGFCARPYSEEDLKTSGFLINEPFVSEGEYFRFLHYFIDNIYDINLHEQSKKNIEKYYQAKIGSKKTIAFDMGYSGRIQKAISRAFGTGVDVLFLHGDNKRMFATSQMGKYAVECFYDYTPTVTGLFREHILSDLSGSCVGFTHGENGLEPILENQRKTIQDQFIVETMQRGALDFVSLWFETFGDMLDYLPFKSHEVVLPFEGYLRCSSDMDLRIFSASYFEDLVYGAKDQINVYEFVRNERLAMPNSVSSTAQSGWSEMVERLVYQRGILCKTLVYAIFDRKLLKDKVKRKLENHPGMLKMCKLMYRAMKKVAGRNR